MEQDELNELVMLKLAKIYLKNSTAMSPSRNYDFIDYLVLLHVDMFVVRK